MSEPQRHPRRRPFRNAVLPPLSTVLNDVELPQRRSLGPNARSLKKGATFHAPSSTPSENSDPVLHVPTLPRRSPTCPKSLEDVIAAGQNRMSGLLGSVERTLSGLGKDSTASSILDNDLPVPRGVLSANIPRTDAIGIDEDPRTLKATANPAVSDSGLGTSVGGSDYGEPTEKQHLPKAPLQQNTVSNLKTAPTTAITRSICLDSLNSSQPSLSSSATRQVERYIIAPILRENKLKPFHSLAQSVPNRISKNDITCLRDLEKTLLYLAPHYATSKNSYLNFCEFTIQCLHTTVGHLNDRDQRLPADRPYTNGYFLDLVEQIRQYAALVSAARARRESNRDKSSNQLDYSSGEELVLKGGLGQTGRPAELVRQKKDKVVSIQTGETYKEPKPAMPSLKRALSTDAGDASVMRSMARRKKNEPPMNINKKCPHCPKVFRRPCDFTKHEKTHIRPWKCSQLDCKYSKRGWPTEKERDRHVNDKHSSSPPLYICLYAPCNYSSKRESNCKQHMEKTHGYEYVRTKNNARNGRRASIQTSPDTPPHLDTPMTRQMSSFTPITAMTPSPYTSPYQHQQQPSHAPNDPGAYDGNMIMKNNGTGLPDFALFPDAAEPGFDDLTAYGPTQDFNTFHTTLQATDRHQYVPTTHAAISPAQNFFNEVPQVPDHSPIDNANCINNMSPVINPSALNNGTAHPNVELTALENDRYLELIGTSMQSSMISTSRSPQPNAPSTCVTSPDLNHYKLSPPLFSPSVQSLDEGFYEHGDQAGTPVTDFSFIEAIDHIIQNPTNPDTMVDAPMEDFDLALADRLFPEMTGQFQDAMWTPPEGSMANVTDVDEWLASI